MTLWNPSFRIVAKGFREVFAAVVILFKQTKNQVIRSLPNINITVKNDLLLISKIHNQVTHRYVKC